MIENLFIIILSLSILLLIIGIFARLLSDNRAFSILTLGSGLLLMFLSFVILGEGYETQTNTETIQYNYNNDTTLQLNNTTNTITKTFIPQKSIYTWGLGFILLLLSLFLMFFSVFDLATSGENEKGV